MHYFYNSIILFKDPVTQVGAVIVNSAKRIGNDLLFKLWENYNKCDLIFTIDWS